jgi:hypothetical protein
MPSLPDPAKERTHLYDFAVSRLRQLFPKTYRQMIKEPIPPPAVVTFAKPAAKIEAVTNTKCVVRACPFPAAVGPLCRSHLADSLADRSLLPSTTQIAISNLECLIA